MGSPYSDRTFKRFDPEALRAVVHQCSIEHRLLGVGDLELRVRNRVGPQFAVDAGDYGCAIYAQGVLSQQALTIGLAPVRRGQVFTNGRPLPVEALNLYAEPPTPRAGARSPSHATTCRPMRGAASAANCSCRVPAASSSSPIRSWSGNWSN